MNDCKIAPDTKYPPGSAATVYHDIDGNEVTLRQLIRLEPEWAHTRIIQCQQAEAKVKHLERQLAKKSEQLKRIVDALFHDDPEHTRQVLLGALPGTQATPPLDAQGNPVFDRR